MTKIRTRYAPSPTGRMHVGNLRTALYAYLIAKHEGGDYLLRIEDGLSAAIETAKTMGMSKDELTDIFHNLLET